MPAASETTRMSLGGIFRRFKWRISLTFLLVALESALSVLYPLLIGLAIDNLLEGSDRGLVNLGILGLASIVIGSARRFYDTRIYAGIYQTVAVELVAREQAAEASISRTAARTTLLTEFVDFLEDSMPELLGALVSLAGILLIVAGICFPVFVGCLLLLLLVALIYSVTARRNFRLNAGFNDQFEQAVDAISMRDSGRHRNHFRRLMHWRIRLSDLETINYGVFWLGAVLLFLYTPVSAISNGIVAAGLILSLLLYVFEFIDWLAEMPTHFQQFIRLKEIANRLVSDNKDASA